MSAELDERVSTLEAQVQGLVEITKAVAAAVVKERQLNEQLVAAVKVLIGDVTQQVAEKALSVTSGDVTFDLAGFSKWVEESNKDTSLQVPDGIQEFASFAMGQDKRRQVPRT